MDTFNACITCNKLLHIKLVYVKPHGMGVYAHDPPS